MYLVGVVGVSDGCGRLCVVGVSDGCGITLAAWWYTDVQI